jgi:hypothetical protein
MNANRFSSRFLVLLILLSFAASLKASNQNNPLPRTLAVIIAISKYAKLPAGRHLQFAERNAALMASALQTTGIDAGNVRLLVGAEATVAAIKTAMGVWLARSAPDKTQSTSQVKSWWSASLENRICSLTRSWSVKQVDCYKLPVAAEVSRVSAAERDLPLYAEIS